MTQRRTITVSVTLSVILCSLNREFPLVQALVINYTVQRPLTQGVIVSSDIYLCCVCNLIRVHNQSQVFTEIVLSGTLVNLGWITEHYAGCSAVTRQCLSNHLYIRVTRLTGVCVWPLTSKPCLDTAGVCARGSVCVCEHSAASTDTHRMPVTEDWHQPLCKLLSPNR